MLAELELQLRVAVAVGGTVTLDGVMAPHVKPAGTVSVRLTVPLKAPTAVTVMVDDADVPTATEAGEVAAIVKSEIWKTNVAVVE